MKTAEAASPFDCSDCSEREKSARNCFNRLGLSDEARAVTAYTEAVKAELAARGAKKVFGLGDLRLYECPLSYLTTDTAEAVRAVYLAEMTGHLPLAGGYADQPCWFMDGYEIYKTERARHGDEPR